MTSGMIGPGVRRLREALVQGERPDGADLIREYPDEASAITDEVRNASVRDSMARERTWLIRARVLGGAGEDVALGTTVRGERTERGLTRKALTQAVRERGANLRPAALAELEANRMASVDPAVWSALIAELELDRHEVVAGVRMALAAEQLPELDVEAHLERLRGALGLPTLVPLGEPGPERASRDDEGAVAPSTGDAMDRSPATLVENWYRGEAARVRSPRGVPNAGLHVLERFRDDWPLRDRNYLTEGGGQVAGLSGASGDIIIRRFAPEFMSIGTEAGRTSRSTPGAARRLAEALNALPREIGIDAAARAGLADQMQRWIVEVVLAPELAPRAPAIAVRPGEPLERALDRHLDVMAANSAWARSAERLLIAALDVVLPGKATTEKARPRRDLRLGDTSIALSELPTLADVEACAAAIEAGMRCLILTPSHRTLASAQLLEAAGLHDVDVDSAARFVSRIIDVASAFEPTRRNEFIEALNERSV